MIGFAVECTGFLFRPRTARNSENCHRESCCERVSVEDQMHLHSNSPMPRQVLHGSESMS